VEAIPLHVGQIVRGTTVGRTSEGERACGAASASYTADVWYFVEGHNQYLYATTCTDSVDNGSLDTQLSVFLGSCEKLSCVDGNDDDMEDTCPSHKSGVHFFAAEGSRYYLLIHGYGSLRGDFSLQIKTDKSNDRCEDAVPLFVGQVIQGTTVGMTSQGEPACGGASASNRADVWYTVTVPISERLVVTTRTNNASINTNYDSQISVFTGRCGRLDCVAGNDDRSGSDRKSEVTFLATHGVRYYILVHGFEGSQGAFALQVKPA
jgi:hypothetical protein